MGRPILWRSRTLFPRVVELSPDPSSAIESVPYPACENVDDARGVSVPAPVPTEAAAVVYRDDDGVRAEEFEEAGSERDIVDDWAISSRSDRDLNRDDLLSIELPLLFKLLLVLFLLMMLVLVLVPRWLSRVYC